MLVWPWEEVVNTAAWGVTLAAGIAVLVARGRHRPSRSFGLFVTAIAMTGLLSNAIYMETTAEGKASYAKAMGAVAIAAIFAAIHFMTSWPRSRSRTRWLDAALVAGAIVAEIAWVVAGAPPAAVGAIAYGLWGTLAVGVLVYLRDFAREPEGPMRESLFLVAAAWVSTVVVDVVYTSLAERPAAGAFPAEIKWMLSGLAFYVCAYATWLYVRRWRGGPASPGRQRRDRIFALAWATGVLGALPGAIVVLAGQRDLGFRIWEVGGSVACAGALTFLAFTVVRYQMLGLDVRVKWVIRRGPVAGAFVAVFFVVSEGAQALFSEQVGPVLGLVAAGILVFAIHPIQRFSERLSEAALPGVKPLSTLSASERAALYLEQARYGWSDGTLTVKDRHMLDVSREGLGIGLDEAYALERRAMGGRSRSAAPGVDRPSA